MYIAFLDEFGHIGPFISRGHPQYGHSPVFGLAGYIIPHFRTRTFATWFFNQKNLLLESEIKRSGVHPAAWEKKGSSLFTTRNIRKYPNIPRTFSRLTNKIKRLDGKIFYYGREKYQTPDKSHATGLYTTVLAHTIRQIDRFCTEKNETYLMILDQHDDRIRLLESAAKTMFGAQPARNLLEPPLQVESHLYQTIQAADWIATIIGRRAAYKMKPTEFADWEWAEMKFGQRIDGVSTHSVLWRPSSSAQSPKADTAPAPVPT